jgi:hypothetical protein
MLRQLLEGVCYSHLVVHEVDILAKCNLLFLSLLTLQVAKFESHMRAEAIFHGLAIKFMSEQISRMRAIQELSLLCMTDAPFDERGQIPLPYLSLATPYLGVIDVVLKDVGLSPKVVMTDEVVLSTLSDPHRAYLTTLLALLALPDGPWRGTILDRIPRSLSYPKLLKRLRRSGAANESSCRPLMMGFLVAFFSKSHHWLRTFYRDYMHCHAQVYPEQHAYYMQFADHLQELNLSHLYAK